MLHDAGQVAESDIDELNVVLLDVLQDFIELLNKASSRTAGTLPHAPEWEWYVVHGRSGGLLVSIPNVSAALPLT